MSWLYGQMCEFADGGKRDVDAFLAGLPLPSKERVAEDRLAVLLAAGGEQG